MPQLHPPWLRALLKEMEVSEADLAANKQGQLGPSQRQKVVDTLRVAYGIAIICGVVGLVGVGVLLANPGQVWVGLGVALVEIFCLIIGGLSVWGIGHRNVELRQNQVVVLDTKLTRRRMVGSAVCAVVFDKLWLPISPNVYAQLPEGVWCRAYHTPHSKMLLAVELSP